MNRNKIDKTWNEFSELKNIELKYKERNQGTVIQSHYLINYTDEVEAFSFIGILRKSAEGQYTDKTSIIVEFKNRLAIHNFELETASEPKNILSIENATEFEKSILKHLEKFGGTSITLIDNFIRIDADHIFSTIDEFNHVTDLIAMIKTTGNT